MTFDEALDYSHKQQPQIMYLGGKTSTGKSTFANLLKRSLGYNVVELDQIVISAVMGRVV